jgi:penicillin-binding protein 1A
VIPYVIAQVKTTDGKLLYKRGEGGLGRVLDPDAVSMMNAMMRETFLTGTARKGEISGWETAGKTGTSQDFRDAWFVGYTGSLVTGVWLGNDDGSPTKRLSGSNLPVEVWSRFMRTALAGQVPVPLPGGGEWRGSQAPAEVASAGGEPGRVASARPLPRQGDWIPPAPTAGKNLLERLFGL